MSDQTKYDFASTTPQDQLHWKQQKGTIPRSRPRSRQGIFGFLRGITVLFLMVLLVYQGFKTTLPEKEQRNLPNVLNMEGLSSYPNQQTVAFRPEHARPVTRESHRPQTSPNTPAVANGSRRTVPEETYGVSLESTGIAFVSSVVGSHQPTGWKTIRSTADFPVLSRQIKEPQHVAAPSPVTTF